ncbi:MAG TPA: PAS domain S-box protein [Myxococcota bacterium]|nr:PAS domain S-box protein [Myxococcota bacterium]
MRGTLLTASSSEPPMDAEALRHGISIAQAVVEAAVDAIAIIDERGAVESANPALERLFGYRRDEIIGQNVRVLMPAPYRDEHDTYLRAYLSTGSRRIIGIGREVVGQRKDGTTFPMYLSVTEIRIAGRRLFAGNMHDLSATKSLEGQLLQAQKMEAIGTLAGGVAHDFNNLLTAILGSAELAASRAAPDPLLARSLERIRLAATRGEALTKRLLAFSRRQVTKPELLALNDAVREARELFERMIGEDIAVRLELASDAGAVRADPSQLDQVIINLVINARDAMLDGGTLRLATRAEFIDDLRAEALGIESRLYSVISIADSGSGIPADVQARMFEPFFTTKAPGRGTGLGLSTVRGIVQNHRGAITCHSQMGRGTRFEIFLPRVAEDAYSAVAPARRRRSARALGRTILIVEDDELMRDLMREVLELDGHRVLAADRPEQALGLTQDAAIDLVITDVVMPGMTGFELVRRLRVKGLDPRIIYMSGYTDAILAERGELAPDDAFLRKPFAIDDLTARIKEVLA